MLKNSTWNFGSEEVEATTLLERVLDLCPLFPLWWWWCWLLWWLLLFWPFCRDLRRRLRSCRMGWLAMRSIKSPPSSVFFSTWRKHSEGWSGVSKILIMLCNLALKVMRSGYLGSNNYREVDFLNKSETTSGGFKVYINDNFLHLLSYACRYFARRELLSCILSFTVTCIYFQSSETISSIYTKLIT